MNDFHLQESFYAQIVDRYLKLYALPTAGDDLDSQFASLTLASQQPKGLHASKWATPAAVAPLSPPAEAFVNAASVRDAAPPTHDVPAFPTSESAPRELQTIIGAMRKLREGFVASRRTDLFAQRAYIFIIRAMILVRNWEAYQPALLYLLHHVHRDSPLTSPELHEFATYLVLDAACRQHDLNLAQTTRLSYGLKDKRLRSAMRCLVRDDWVTFWKIKTKLDGYQRALFSLAEDRMRSHALKCIGRSYFTAEKLWLEQATNTTWSRLVQAGVGWELVEGNKVIIKRPKSK